MLTFALLNRKGGVGKTSLTIHLAGAYARKGKRVLLLDLDPQASLTQGLLGPEKTDSLPPSATVAGLFGDLDINPATLPVKTSVAGVALVPGSEALDDINVPRPSQAGPYQTAVAELLQAVASDYDLALIDCPPTLYLCSWCALLASDHIVVPLMADQFGSHSLIAMHNLIAEARARNPRLTVLGMVINKLQPRLAIHQLYESNLREMYGDRILVNAVPLLADYGIASASGQPVEQVKPRSKAARVIRAVADELLLLAHVGGQQEQAAAAEHKEPQ